MREFKNSETWGGRGIQLAVVLVLGASCGSDREPLGTQSGASEPTSGPEPTGGGQPTGGTGGITEGSATETGGAAPTREVCEKYLDCIAVATPEALPEAQTGFGPNGSCWEGPPESIEQCIAACVAGLDTLRLANLDIAQCVDCLDAAECDGELACFEGLCVDGYCGDGVVADDEVCDIANEYYFECGDCDKNDFFECNPFSNHGCEAGDECYYDYFGGFAVCVSGDLEGLGDGATCDLYNDSGYCGPGLTCVSAELVAGCPDYGCCTVVCNAQEPDGCPNGRVCAPVFDYMGACLPE